MKTTRGADSHFGPARIHTHAASYPQARQRLAPPRPGPALPDRPLGRWWERPPGPRAWCGLGARCVFTPRPTALPGSLPAKRFLREGCRTDGVRYARHHRSGPRGLRPRISRVAGLASLTRHVDRDGREFSPSRASSLADPLRGRTRPPMCGALTLEHRHALQSESRFRPCQPRKNRRRTQGSSDVPKTNWLRQRLRELDDLEVFPFRGALLEVRPTRPRPGRLCASGCLAVSAADRLPAPRSDRRRAGSRAYGAPDITAAIQQELKQFVDDCHSALICYVSAVRSMEATQGASTDLRGR